MTMGIIEEFRQDDSDEDASVSSGVSISHPFPNPVSEYQCWEIAEA